MSIVTRERRSWTVREDQLLRTAVEKEDPGNPTPSKWHAIAKHVPNRTNKDCRKRWFAKMASDVVKGGWAPDEDERLMKGIERYGTRWSLVASVVQSRNSDQCAKRWTDTLNPAIDRTSWTPEADEQLIQAVNQYGKVWTRIVRMYFPGRTGLSAKNRYNSITRFGAENSRTRTRRRSPDTTTPYPVNLGQKVPRASSSSSSGSSSPRQSSPSEATSASFNIVPQSVESTSRPQSNIFDQLSGWSPTTSSEHSGEYAYHRITQESDLRTSSPSTSSSNSPYLYGTSTNTFIPAYTVQSSSQTAPSQHTYASTQSIPRDVIPSIAYSDQRRINPTQSSFPAISSHNVRQHFSGVYECRDLPSNFSVFDTLPAETNSGLSGFSWDGLSTPQQDTRSWQRYKSVHIPIEATVGGGYTSF